MNTKRLVIAAMTAAVYFLAAVVSTPLFVFLILVAFWGGLWVGIRSALYRWRQLPFLEKAQHVSDIRRVDYFRRVPSPQLENWVLASLIARGFVVLGDPVLGRSRIQGYAWLQGKKTVVVMRPEGPLKDRDLDRIYNLKNKCHAEAALVFSPFSSAPRSNRPGLDILAGKKFLSWMKVLDSVRPINIGALPPQTCSCGAPQVEHVSRAGEPVLICSRFPDCQEVQRPNLGNLASAPSA